ncbi:hypothetical protein ACHAW6_004755 [Cyclotella cf. meneghiniana]
MSSICNCKCLDSCIVDQPQSINEEQSISLLESIKECHSLSKQTYELCTSTLVTGKNLVARGETIQKSLIGATSELSAESFSVIADLIDGDAVKEARGLAGSMKEKSSECMSLSLQMVTSLERSVRALPDVIEQYVEKKASESIAGEMTSEERDLADVDSDVKDLTDCIDAIENLSLITAVQAGTNAFRGITEKGQQCHHIFQIIEKFAYSLTTITEAFLSMDVSGVISKMKDILRAIGLTTMIRKFAEGCKKMIEKVVELFQAAAGKLSLLWKSLVTAKDKMVESLTDVIGARSLCVEAGEQMDNLKDLVTSLGMKFWDVRNLNPDTFKILKSMDNDRSLDDAMQTTRGIDDSVEAAVQQMQNVARRVQDEYNNLPPMITDGISDASDDDDVLNDTARKNVDGLQNDIQEMQASAKTIEELNATKAMHEEVSRIAEKIEKCKDTLQLCTGFADKSKSSIDSFLGKWSLETAVSQIQKMCQLVSLSKVMEQIASQMQQLIRAMGSLLNAIALRLKAVVAKAQRMMSLGGGGVDSVVDAATDFVSDGLNSAVQNAGNLISDGCNNLFGTVLDRNGKR